MTDIIYLAWQRLKFTQFSFQKLVEGTDWGAVQRLIVYDDGSTDGTSHWLSEQVVQLNRDEIVQAEMHHTAFRSPVRTMNHYLDNYQSDVFAKIDSDIVVPPGWLQEMNRMLYLNPGLDILGMQADIGPPVEGRCNDRWTEKSRWIGGVGMIRRKTFSLCRPSPNGRFGWTEFQQNHKGINKAWIKPDLPTFELDRVPIEAWQSLARQYIDLGWAREWSLYPDDANAYWDWAFKEEN